MMQTQTKTSDTPFTPTAQRRAVLAGTVFLQGEEDLSAAPTAEEEPAVGQKRAAPAVFDDDDLRLALQRAAERRAKLAATLRAKRLPPVPDTVPVNVYHARVHRDYNKRTTTVLDSVLQNSGAWTLEYFRAVTRNTEFPFHARFGAALDIYVYGPRNSKVLVRTNLDAPTMRHDALRAYNSVLRKP